MGTKRATEGEFSRRDAEARSLERKKTVKSRTDDDDSFFSRKFIRRLRGFSQIGNCGPRIWSTPDATISSVIFVLFSKSAFICVNLRTRPLFCGPSLPPRPHTFV
jgi:hypothetical protein